MELFDGILPVLTDLRRKYLIGLLPNSNTYPWCIGLENMVRFVILAQDHVVAKPDPKMFYIALKKTRCLAKELADMSDSLEDDIQRDVNAGVKGIWPNRTQIANNLDLKIAYNISTLAELLEILQ